MKSDLVRFLGCVGLIGFGGCRSITEPAALTPEAPRFTCIANSATMRLPAELRAAFPPRSGPMDLNDVYAAISESVPGGFAGVFMEGGTLVLTFVDPARANEARAEIREAFVSRGFFLNPPVDFSTAEFRGARWTFAELAEWYRYILSQPVFGPESGVSSIDIDEKENTITFGVIDEAARARLESRLAALRISCNLVTTVIQAYAVPS